MEKDILLEIMKKGVILEQTILAKETGIPVQNINAWVRGRVSPRLSTLVKIADAVGLKLTVTIERKSKN